MREPVLAQVGEQGVQITRQRHAQDQCGAAMNLSCEILKPLVAALSTQGMSRSARARAPCR